MIRLISGPTMLKEAELTTYLRAHLWFLDRARDDGIRSTSAGYLKPADVVTASEIVPAMGDWIGTNNREVHCAPLLAARLLPGTDDTFETQATLLLLAYAGSSNNSELPLDEIATALNEFGWRHPDGRPVSGSALYRLPAFDVLINVSDRPASWDERRRISPAAATLARAALHYRIDGNQIGRQRFWISHHRVAIGSSNSS